MTCAGEGGEGVVLTYRYAVALRLETDGGFCHRPVFPIFERSSESLMKYKAIDKKLFIENRKKFVALLQPKSIAVFNSNDEMPRNGDGNFPFRQNSDLFWLSGIDQEQTVLVLAPEHPLPEYREALFLRKTNEHIAIWEGHNYTKDEASEASGIQHVYGVDEFKTMLPVMMHHSSYVYVNLNENDRFVTEVPYREERFAKDLKTRYPNHRYERSGPLMA